MPQCTWKDCQSEAKHPQVGKDGKMWANLCDEHNSEIDKAMVASDVKGILCCWVHAQGGAKRAAARMTSGD